MEQKYFANIVLNKEKLSNGKIVFVVHCTNLGIASQGCTTEEAIENIKEAIELYLEEEPEKYGELSLSNEPPIFSFIEVKKNAKITNFIR
jgi:predicted RNase H-like HicB family nuclease